MMNQTAVDAYLNGIRVLVDPSSRIELFHGSILMLELQLKPEHKDSVCRQINRLLKLIKASFSSGPQMIVAVLDDDNDRFVRLVGQGIEGKEIDTDQWANAGA